MPLTIRDSAPSFPDVGLVAAVPLARLSSPANGRRLPLETLDRLKTDLLDGALTRRDGDLHLGARNIYTDPELFELEIKHLFEAGWVYAAHESQLPNANDFLTLNIAGNRSC